MTRASRHALEFASRFWVHLFAGFGVTLLTWLLVRRFDGPQTNSAAGAGVVLGICFLSTLLVIALLLINRENFRLKQSIYDLHAINHIYREALSELFSAHSAREPHQSDQLLIVEREVLTSVCGKIAHIFSALIGRKCVVTTKLLADSDGTSFCFTWARSEREILRDESGIEKFIVGSGENTGFDEALRPRESSASYFHAADLLRLSAQGGYKNQRPGWQRLYRSAIVVPIRHVSRSQNRTDVIGFLCVDTMSVNRLNDGYHVQFLAAFADQMYNFLSIMRRRYSLAPEADASRSRQIG